MPLNAQLTLSILAHETSDADLSRSLKVTPVSYSASLSDGTGAGQAQAVWSRTRTLASSSESVTHTLTAVKVAYVRNKGTSPLSFSGLPFSSVAGGAAAMHSDPSAAGFSATGVTVTGTVGGAYEIVLIGEGSPS